MVKVSVIIPVYNSESYLQKCIESVLAQSLKEIEVICVDDGSTDSSFAILHGYERQDSRVKIIRQANARQGAARNVGIRVAKGEYIGFVDSDDTIPVSYYSSLYSSAVASDADIAVAGIVNRYPHYSKQVIGYSQFAVYETAQLKLEACSCPPEFYIMNKIYRLSMIHSLGISFAEKVQYEDVMFTIRAICESGKLVTVKDVSYDYYYHPTSTVNVRQSAAKQLEKYRAHKQMVAYVMCHGLTIPDKYYNLTKRHLTYHGFCVWKIKEKNGVETLRLFDFLPIFSRRPSSEE